MDPHADQPISATAAFTTPLRWVVFCRVIDNLGDIGVCWRLCADLAARGHQVQLWIDQPEALAWMAPGALQGLVNSVQVIPWSTPRTPGLQAAVSAAASADVWVEAFGCEPDDACEQALSERMAHRHGTPVWINLEYLSAETYVERSHTLPSLRMRGPARGLTHWFYYPGFNERTGGLLREPGLAQRQAAFNAQQWLASTLPERALAPAGDDAARSRRVSLFCYEPAVLPRVLQGADEDSTPSEWFITPGRAAAALSAARPGWEQAASRQAADGCRLRPLPSLSQPDFDHLLWTCDLNFVRGEDSLVRALWAGKPFVWHIYPQHDNAHHAKLQAFLDWLDAPASLRAFHLAWNGVGATGGGWPGWAVVDSWRPCAQAARERLLAQPDLVTQLLGFVAEKR